MPNGRSGGFILKSSELIKLLNQFDTATVVGHIGTKTPLAAHNLREMLVQWNAETFVEEQDSAWYILHLPEWVTVNEGSPLFNPLRQLHIQWLQEVGSERMSEETATVAQAIVTRPRPRSLPRTSAAAEAGQSRTHDPAREFSSGRPTSLHASRGHGEELFDLVIAIIFSLLGYLVACIGMPLAVLHVPSLSGKIGLSITLLLMAFVSINILSALLSGLLDLFADEVRGRSLDDRQVNVYRLLFAAALIIAGVAIALYLGPWLYR